MKKNTIYIFGVFIFGLAQGFIREKYGGAATFICGIVYAIAVSYLANKLGK